MTEGRIEDLVLLHLLEREESPRYERSTPGIAATLGLDETMAERVSLFSALSSLTTRELLDSSVESVDGLHGDRTVYSLTPAGRDRAIEFRERVSEESVVVHTERTQEVPLGAVPDEYDLSLVGALTARSPDGALYLDSEPESTFVGRGNELDRLVATLAGALDGEPQVAAISGASGSGKTELVDGLAEEARVRGFDVMVGRCRREGGGPYHPFEEAIERVSDERLEELFDTDGSTVTDEESYEAEVSSLFYGIATWLAGRANDQPLVLIVEDVQWADAATLDLLEYLLEALERAPLVIVWSVRSGPLRSDERLSSFLDSTTADGVHVELDSLDRDAVVELLEGYVGHRGVPDSFVDVVVDGTGGNPLFVVETVESLLEDGTIDPVRGVYPERVDEIDVPDVVGTTIQRRLDRLDPNTRSVVEMGAIVGDTVRFDLLSTITEHAELQLREYVDALVDGGVWRREGQERYRFVSDVLRTTVYESIDEEERRERHRIVGDALVEETRDSSEHHAAIAHHYERGGEPELALEHAIEAGEGAKRLYAYDVAVEYYEQALRLARELDRDETVLETLEALGDIYYTRGRYDEADKHFRYIRERTDDPERVRRTYRYQAQLCFDRGEYEDTERYAGEGLAVGGDEVTREVCRLQDHLAGSYFKRGDFETSIEGHKTLRELAESINDDLMLGRAFQNIGCCHMRLDDDGAAVEHLERAVPLFVSEGDDRELVGCLNDLSIAYDAAGEYDRAKETLYRGREIAERTGDVMAKLRILHNLSIFAQYDGEWDTAREYIEETYEVARHIENDDSLAFALSGKASIAVAQGSLQDAIDHIRCCLDIVRQSDRKYQLSMFLPVLGWYYILDASFERATGYIEEGLAIAHENGFEQVIAYGTKVDGILERERGNVDVAIDRQKEGLDCIQEIGRGSDLATHRIELAETLSRGGDPETGLEESEAALAALVELDTHRRTEVSAEIARGTALNRLGEYEVAREQLTAALEPAQSMSNVATLRTLRELALLEAETESGSPLQRVEEGRELALEAEMGLFVETFDSLEERISSR